MPLPTSTTESALVESLAKAIRNKLLIPGEEKIKQLEARLTEELDRERINCRQTHDELTGDLILMERRLARLKVYCYVLTVSCTLALAGIVMLFSRII